MKISTRQLKNIIAEELAEALPNIQRMTTKKGEPIQKLDFNRWREQNQERIQKDDKLDYAMRQLSRATQDYYTIAGKPVLTKEQLVQMYDQIIAQVTNDANMNEDHFESIKKKIIEKAKQVEPKLKTQQELDRERDEAHGYSAPTSGGGGGRGTSFEVDFGNHDTRLEESKRLKQIIKEELQKVLKQYKVRQ